VLEKLISKPPNVLVDPTLSEPARGAYSVPPNPVPELKRNDKGRGKER